MLRASTASSFTAIRHQPRLDRLPGMTMGPYGVHWERTQTWWEMVAAYHLYLSRCQQLLRRGLFVADILYLTPEGAPQRLPPAAFGYGRRAAGPARLQLRRLRSGHPDRAGLGEGRPDRFARRHELPGAGAAAVHDDDARACCRRLSNWLETGATIIGTPPRKSPSLTVIRSVTSRCSGLPPSCGAREIRSHSVPPAWAG